MWKNNVKGKFEGLMGRSRTVQALLSRRGQLKEKVINKNENIIPQKAPDTSSNKKEEANHLQESPKRTEKVEANLLNNQTDLCNN